MIKTPSAIKVIPDYKHINTRGCAALGLISIPKARTTTFWYQFHPIPMREELVHVKDQVFRPSISTNELESINFKCFKRRIKIVFYGGPPSFSESF